MSAWTNRELEAIDASDELQLASLTRDGALRRPVTIWVVRMGEDLYVRSWRGRDGKWWRGVQERHEGRISAGGIDKDVVFVDADDAVDDAIDAAYRTKYARYDDASVDPMVRPEARATTIRLVPRPASA
jgi:hypothetical protein